MECSKTKRLANKDWPLYPTTDAGQCCYKVVVNSEKEAAEVVADAKTKPDYVGCSEFCEAPSNKIQFYLDFKRG